MSNTLTQSQKIHYNSTFLGMITDPSERLKFVMNTLYPDYCWNVSQNHLGLMVGYSCDAAPGPKISEEEVFGRLSEEFGIRNQRMKYSKGLARQALKQVVFTNPDNAKSVFFA